MAFFTRILFLWFFMLGSIRIRFPHAEMGILLILIGPVLTSYGLGDLSLLLMNINCLKVTRSSMIGSNKAIEPNFF